MQAFNDVFLHSMAIAEPDVFKTSDEIENELAPLYDRLKLPFGRIEMQTGVVSRGFYPGRIPSEIATLAGKNLFAENEINPGEIDLLIYCGVCRDYLEPSTASAIHHHLGLNSACQSFDLSNACLGMVNAMSMSAKLIESGAYKNILLVTGENSYPLVSKMMETLLEDQSINRKSIKKYFANFTIGSAGVAMVISKGRGLAKLVRSQSLSNTATYELCRGDGSTSGLTMETDSEKLMQEGIELAKKCWQDFDSDNFDHFICHQVGIHHRNFLYDQLRLDLKKDTTTFDRYGNTGSAALPLTLFKAEPKFKTGDRIALLGIGSGLHTTVMEIQWI